MKSRSDATPPRAPQVFRSCLRALLLVLLLVALPLPSTRGSSAPQEAAPQGAAPREAAETYSNIHPEDYVGPRVCAECHEEKYAEWRDHPHSRMNLDASAQTVLGDFSGLELDYGGGQVRFARTADGAYTMTLMRAGASRSYRVTRTVGSRFTQMYVGVQTDGPEPSGHPVYRREGKLAFGWWIARKAWFPEPYFDSDCPPEYGPAGRVALPAEEAHGTDWQRNCIYCHNTYPFEERLREGTGLTGFPEGDLALREAGDDPSPGLSPRELVTLGISCESCHFGGREHASSDGEAPIRFLPSSPALQFPKATPARIAAARDDPYVVNSICAQCHFSRGVSPYPNGAGTWNSREAIDLVGGACASRIRCTDCHDPHLASPPGGGPDQAKHLAACLQCHPAFADRATRDDHTQHSEGVSCLDCHMPRMVQGLEAVVRTHRISAPGDPRMLNAGAPNACNLCHLDRSLEWTVAALEIGWGRRVAPQPEGSKVNRGVAAGHLWLTSKVPSHRLVGADAYSRSALGRQEVPRLIRTLDDPMAVNRMFGLFSLERVLGRQLRKEEYAPIAPPGTRREQVRRLLDRYEQTDLTD